SSFGATIGCTSSKPRSLAEMPTPALRTLRAGRWLALLAVLAAGYVLWFVAPLEQLPGYTRVLALFVVFWLVETLSRGAARVLVQPGSPEPGERFVLLLRSDLDDEMLAQPRSELEDKYWWLRSYDRFEEELVEGLAPLGPM